MVSLGLGAGRNGVETTGVPRMTFGDAPHTQAQAAKAAVSAHGVFGIYRTAREEAALAPHPWAENQSIAADDKD